MEQLELTVGQRLRLKRNEYGYTVTQLAKLIGVSKGNISSYESDRNVPQAKTLVKYSSCLGCSIDWIITGKEFSSNSVSSTMPTSKEAEELLRYCSVFDEQDMQEMLLLAKAKYQKYKK